VKDRMSSVQPASFGDQAEIVFVNVHREFPSGVKYLMVFLKNRGVRVRVVDVIGPDQEQKLATLEKLPSGAVFAFCCYTSQIKNILRLIGVLKKSFPDSKVVLGNIHATVFYQELLKEKHGVDFVVLGEGEVPLLDIVEFVCGQRKLDQLRNVAYRDAAGQVVLQRDDNALADLNDLSIVDIEKIRSGGGSPFFYFFRTPWRSTAGPGRVAVLSSSRGCPMGCSYCSEASMTKGQWRGQAPEVTMRDLEELAVNGIRHVFFCDPFFTYDRSRVIDLCALLKKKRLQVSWVCYAHPGFLDPEMVQAMGEAGCNCIIASIDCGHAKRAKKYRTVDLDFLRLRENIRVARRNRMFFKINLIIGWPEETLGDVLSLGWKLLKLHATHFSVFVLMLFPGAKLFEEAVSKGQIQPDYWLHSARDYYRSYHLYTGISRFREILCLALKRVVLDVFLLLSCRSLYGFSYYLSQTSRWGMSAVLMVYKKILTKCRFTENKQEGKPFPGMVLEGRCKKQ